MKIYVLLRDARKASFLNAKLQEKRTQAVYAAVKALDSGLDMLTVCKQVRNGVYPWQQQVTTCPWSHQPDAKAHKAAAKLLQSLASSEGVGGGGDRE